MRAYSFTLGFRKSRRSPWRRLRPRRLSFRWSCFVLYACLVRVDGARAATAHTMCVRAHEYGGDMGCRAQVVM